MIGIYKITKIKDGKSYIGQSNDIERRFSEHKTKTDIPIEIAIQKYGEKAFTFEVLEECDLSLLDEREKYWIQYYNTYKGNGYNCNEGGGKFAGEDNGNTKLTNEDVIFIRKSYNNHCRRKEIYEKFKDKIAFDSFASIWDGTTWKHIMPEVYTKENKDYYMYHSTDGENSTQANFTNEEVLLLRKRYINETAKEIYKDYSDRCSLNTLQQLLWGRTYKSVPIYNKKKKEWINKNL